MLERVPGVGVSGEAVEQQEWRAPLAAPVQAVQAQAVDGDIAVGGPEEVHGLRPRVAEAERTKQGRRFPLPRRVLDSRASDCRGGCRAGEDGAMRLLSDDDAAGPRTGGDGGLSRAGSHLDRVQRRVFPVAPEPRAGARRGPREGPGRRARSPARAFAAALLPHRQRDGGGLRGHERGVRPLLRRDLRRGWRTRIWRPSEPRGWPGSS